MPNRLRLRRRGPQSLVPVSSIPCCLPTGSTLKGWSQKHARGHHDHDGDDLKGQRKTTCDVVGIPRLAKHHQHGQHGQRPEDVGGAVLFAGGVEEELGGCRKLVIAFPEDQE
jgi:hypothetical protein